MPRTVHSGASQPVSRLPPSPTESVSPSLRRVSCGWSGWLTGQKRLWSPVSVGLGGFRGRRVPCAGGGEEGAGPVCRGGPLTAAGRSAGLVGPSTAGPHGPCEKPRGPHWHQRSHSAFSRRRQYPCFIHCAHPPPTPEPTLTSHPDCERYNHQNWVRIPFSAPAASTQGLRGFIH